MGRCQPAWLRWRAVFATMRYAALLTESCGGKLDPVLEHFSNSVGMTPLHYAVQHGDLALVRVLLAARAHPELCNRRGFTPLQVAQRIFGGVVPMAIQSELVQD